jgi:tRNA(fMet)-specific endonuclease VapC
MRIAVDTNRYVDFAKGLPEAVDRLRRADEILVPFIVLGELRAGFAGGSRSGPNEANLARFLDSSRVGVMLADEDTTHHYARLFQQLRRQGTPIPTNDLRPPSLRPRYTLRPPAADPSVVNRAWPVALTSPRPWRNAWPARSPVQASRNGVETQGGVQ